jgi:glycosyltransferase involved in cell wall biosynthesis
VSATVISTLRNALFVFEVRDLWPESITSISDVDNLFLIGAIDAVVRLAYRRADRIVVVSRAFEDDIESMGVAPDSIWYHPNGVDPSFVSDTETATPLPDGLADTIRNRFVVSYVGTVGRAHGLEIVLDGAAELAEDDAYDDVCFLVVGYGTELNTLRSAADQRSLDNVVFTGRKPKTMVPSILDATDVSLVHLKPRDLFETVIPSKIFESMGAGLPIVLGVRGEAERILREADAGVHITPGDGRALADAVRDLYDDPDRRATLGENGSRFVREEFAWGRIATAYRQNVEQLATQRRNV